MLIVRRNGYAHIHCSTRESWRQRAVRKSKVSGRCGVDRAIDEYKTLRDFSVSVPEGVPGEPLHWETQYRKVVKEPSCIRKPDTGQQADGLSCFGSGSPMQTKASSSGMSNLGPPLILCHVSDSLERAVLVLREYCMSTSGSRDRVSTVRDSVPWTVWSTHNILDRSFKVT